MAADPAEAGRPREPDPFDRRPADTARHNVYGYTSHNRPDEPGRLRKLILIDSPDDNAPEGGLEISAIDYGGEIWAFDQRRVDPNRILLIAHAANPDQALGEGKFEEAVTIHTNHPHKPELELMFYTAIDSQAGRPEASDPWSHLR